MHGLIIILPSYSPAYSPELTLFGLQFKLPTFFYIYFRKKLQKEIEKKHAARNSLTPTNLDDFDGIVGKDTSNKLYELYKEKKGL